MEKPAWRRVAVHGITGVTEVGFAPGSRFLMVVSELGRAVFSTLTGKRLSRRDEDDLGAWFDDTKPATLGIGPVEGQWIAVAGLGGGALPAVTADGWSVARNSRGVVLAHPDLPPQQIHETEELRAFGFSPEGDCFVLAVTPDVHIYRRGPVSRGPSSRADTTVG